MEEILKRIKIFSWGLLGAGLLALTTFVAGNLDLIEMTNLDPVIKVFVVSVLTNITAQITKAINQKWNLEEKIAGLGRRLAGKG